VKGDASNENLWLCSASLLQIIFGNGIVLLFLPGIFVIGSCGPTLEKPGIHSALQPKKPEQTQGKCFSTFWRKSESTQRKMCRTVRVQFILYYFIVMLTLSDHGCKVSKKEDLETSLSLII
jgi:hypothetical protein